MNIQKCKRFWIFIFAASLFMCGELSASVVTDGLVSWWKFDETSGTTASDSIGSNDGTLTYFPATPTWTNDTPGAASSGALFFDGVNDVVDCGTAFSAISNAMTAELWIKRQGVISPWDVYLSKIQNGDNRWYFRVNPDGRPSAYGKSGGGQIFPGGDFYSTEATESDKWHHVAITCAPDSNSVWYVDGVAKGSGTMIQASLANTGKLLVGAYEGAILATQGLIDDVRVYNRALSAEEILQNYRAIQGDPGVVTTNLVSWWKFDETSGSKARDSWGGGYGTLLNFAASPTWTNDTPGEASSGALWFDGANDYVNTGNKLTSVSNALTTEVWIKYWGVPDPVSVYLTKWESDPTRWYHRINPGSTALAYAKLANTVILNSADFTTPSVVPPDTWLHMVFVASRNGTAYWYVNGEEEASVSVKDLPFYNTADLLIGAYNGGGLPINAVIDDVRIYDRALTAEEVKQNYRVTIPGPPAGTLLMVN